MNEYVWLHDAVDDVLRRLEHGAMEVEAQLITGEQIKGTRTDDRITIEIDIGGGSRYGSQRARDG